MAVVVVEATDSRAVLVGRDDMAESVSQSGRTEAGCGESSRGDGFRYVGECLLALDLISSSR